MDLSLINQQTLINVFNAVEKLALNRLSSDPGLAPGGTTTKFAVDAFSYMLGGVVYDKAAADDVAFPGASTGAGEFRKVLVVIDAAGAITTVAGDKAASQAAATLPATPADKLAIGVLEMGASFTDESSNVTAGMCKAFTHSIDVENS